MALTAVDREEFLDLVARQAAIGGTPLALYGAGEIARSLRPTFGTPAGSVAMIIDDEARKHGLTWAGLPVGTVAEAKERGCRGVVIATEGAIQDAIWKRRAAVRDAGMAVFCCPSRHAGRAWDRCLIDQYEHALAASRGIRVVYPHAYPAPEYAANESVVAMLAERLPEGGTICEIGTGTGLIAERLIGRSGAYHAVDFSARLLHEVLEHRLWAERTKLKLHHDETAGLVGVPDGSVDVLFSYDVLVHFKQDLVHQFLASIRRVLSEGGCAMLHMLAWGPGAIASWERHLKGAYAGVADPMGYNSPDDVAASCRGLGLRSEVLREPDADGRWWAVVRPREDAKE